jgi:lysophospholipase L1-like esterase
MKRRHVAGLLSIIAVMVFGAFVQQSKPTFYIIGDSTVRNPNPPSCSWGELIERYFDPSRIAISNQAIAGRSTRSFLREGRWDKVIADIKPGDFLLIEFGHNDGGTPGVVGATQRSALKGTGQDSVVLDWPDGKKEVVHTFGWYLRKFAREAQAKGATVMIASMVASNWWKDGKVTRSDATNGAWCREIARETGAFFIDANSIIANKYEKMGPDLVKELYTPISDGVHTNMAGAGLNAGSIVEGIKMDTTNTLNKFLAGRPARQAPARATAPAATKP